MSNEKPPGVDFTDIKPSEMEWDGSDHPNINADSSQPSSRTSSEIEDDEHTLCASGDISLTEGYYIPSLPSELPLKRDPNRLRKLSRPPPPLMRKASLVFKDEVSRSLILALRSLLFPACQAAVIQSQKGCIVPPTGDFKTLVESLQLDESGLLKAIVTGENAGRPKAMASSTKGQPLGLSGKAGRSKTTSFTNGSPPVLKAKQSPSKKDNWYLAPAVRSRPPLPRWDTIGSSGRDDSMEKYKARFS